MRSETSLLLTYAELGDRLSIKPASAKRLAQRRKWHRIIGNDGAARIHVPLDVIPQRVTGDDIPDRPDVIASDSDDKMSPPADLREKILYLEGLVEGLQKQIEAERNVASSERQRANAAEARAQDIFADREAWKRQAQRSIWSRLFGSD